MKFFKEKNLFQVIYEGKEGYVITNEDDIFTSPIGTYYLHIEDGYEFIAVITKNTCLGGIKSIWPYYKIIASTFPLGDLPQFVIPKEKDFNTLNDDIDILRNFDYPNLIYEKDLSIKESNAYKNGLVIGYKKGWDKHTEKYKFTEEDIKKAIQLAREADSIDGVVDLPIVLNYPNVDNSDLQIKWTEEEIIQFLQQPKEITEIEFEHIWENQKGITGDNFTDVAIKQPDGEFDAWLALKITKSIKYPNGLLTIKNMKYEK